MNGLQIISPGVLSLIQDAGRFGQGQLGLTQGGPLDGHSFRWANTLVGNPVNSSVIEHSLGGLILEARTPCIIAVTGAKLTLSINQQRVACWQAHQLNAGDKLELGEFSQGLRAYVAVAGGFAITPHFGSTATVMREGMGKKLQAGDILSLPHLAQINNSNRLTRLFAKAQANAKLASTQLNDIATRSLPGPKYLTLRLIEGYQANLFTVCQRARFYLNPYQITPQLDRMGYKLAGSAIVCESKQLLSEGISYGAVQIPPDGQPIVLLNDRQTLGGYPKIGNVLSLDCWRLAQAGPGSLVQFSLISAEEAHNALQLDHARFLRESSAYACTY